MPPGSKPYDEIITEPTGIYENKKLSLFCAGDRQTMATLLTSVDEIPDNSSYLFTVRGPDGTEEEVILVTRDGEVSAWKNFCLHEIDQRLDLGGGATIRDDRIVCPKHGSTFDAETGYCDHGPAAETVLVDVDVTVRHGQIYLTDDDLELLHEGGIEDDDDGPDSTSHLRF